MKKNMSFFILFLFSICSDVFALNIGFDIKNETFFLEKSDAVYIPDISFSFDSSFFYTLHFDFANQNLLLQPGFFCKSISFKDSEIFPFFRRLNYSAFTDTFSFTAGKDSFYFGSGTIDNNFFINIPDNKHKDLLLWHVKFETFIQQFTFTAGATVDTKKIDVFKIPSWYNLWGKIVYSHPVFLIGIENDWLLQPAIQEYDQKKSTVFKTAMEASVSLPKGFTLYANAKLPVNIEKKKIEDWASLIGVSKLSIYKEASFTTSGEIFYSSKRGFKYSFFQALNFGEYIELAAGLHGRENKELHILTDIIFFIGDFKFKLGYTTKNVLLPNNKDGGILSIGAVFNDKI